MKHYESLIIGHITMDHDTDYLGNETLAICIRRRLERKCRIADDSLDSVSKQLHEPISATRLSLSAER